jgi:type III secretion protein U
MTAKFYTMDNMMGKDEVEREHKELEGNPEVKSHRRQLAQEIVLGGDDRLGNASVVVRNPTHIAVALRYEPAVSPVPYIIGMRSGAAALAVIRRAEKLGVPLYTDITLARGIFATGSDNTHVSLEHSAQIVPLIYWLQNNHPDRVFAQSEFASITQVGDVKR